MNDDLKARFCEALGVTVEEVDAFDRATGGPEERAERAKREADFLDYLQAMGALLAERFSAVLPEGVTMRFDE